MRKFRAVPGKGIYASEGTVMLPERLELQLQDFAQAYSGVDYTDIYNLNKNWGSMNDGDRKKIKKLLSAIRRSCNETGLDPYELAREYPEDKATCDELVALITAASHTTM